MGRYYNGDIEGKLAVGTQDSNAADRFGVIGQRPAQLYYYFDEDSIPNITNELQHIEDSLGSNFTKIKRFFLTRTLWNEEALIDYMQDGFSVTLTYYQAQQFSRDYFDYRLGEQILDQVERHGSCEFYVDIE
jgi:hypothetical protein